MYRKSNMKYFKSNIVYQNMFDLLESLDSQNSPVNPVGHSHRDTTKSL